MAHLNRRRFAIGSLAACTGVSVASGHQVFELRGIRGTIGIHVRSPSTLTEESPILLVIPGSGRSARSYLEPWLKTSERNSVLVASLRFSEHDYDFAAYHMGGVIKNLRLPPIRPDKRGVLTLSDEAIQFDFNPDPTRWIFADIERVFDFLRRHFNNQRETYDVFGHSAGGQILHRMAVFGRGGRASRIVAANSGFYTLPELSVPLPTGLLGTGLQKDDLIRAFKTNLTVLLGEDDNGEHAGRTLLRTPAVDLQGQGRLQRGKSFLESARRVSREFGVPLHWRLKTVPNTGHNFRKMSEAAASLLY